MFLVSGSNDWVILMEDVSEDIAFIPLKQGILSEVLVVGEDNVGNRDESGTNIQTIYIPSLTCKECAFCFHYKTCFQFIVL